MKYPRKISFGLFLSLLSLLFIIGATNSILWDLGPLEATASELNQAKLFIDVAPQVGLDYESIYISAQDVGSEVVMIFSMSGGGVAAGDYDQDGYIDLYVARGDVGPDLLFHNQGDGTFVEVGTEASLNRWNPEGRELTFAEVSVGTRSSPWGLSSGPTFADINGDGWLDLFVGGLRGVPQELFYNNGDGTFSNVTNQSGLIIDYDTFSSAFGDYDLDGDLDLFMAHWRTGATEQILWQNDGQGQFTDVSQKTGISSKLRKMQNFMFTPNFADINNDRWPDVVVTGDFEHSQIFINQGDGTFVDQTDPLVITDQNGMGAAVADYDSDGDLDWFVSSVWDPNGIIEGNAGLEKKINAWDISGNRLYQNQGDGTFVDVTDKAGVREGFWGWGSCFADFNNDTYLDIFQVNGLGAMFPTNENFNEFRNDPSRLFMNRGDGSFQELSLALGIDDTDEGRGIVCFDYQRDGDIDIFIHNLNQPPSLYRNNLDGGANYLGVKLQGLAPNKAAIGARIFVTLQGQTQMRELQVGSNFLSQNPVEAHFGLGQATLVDEVRVEWPGLIKKTTILKDVAVNQFLVIQIPKLGPMPIRESIVCFDEIVGF